MLSLKENYTLIRLLIDYLVYLLLEFTLRVEELSDLLFGQWQQLGIYSSQLFLEGLLIFPYGDGMLNNVGVVSLQVTIAPGEDVGVFFHQVDVFLPHRRWKGSGQFDDPRLSRRPDIYLFDVVAVWN